MIRVAFFGERKTGADCLLALSDHQGFEIVGVVSHSREPCCKDDYKISPVVHHDGESKSALLDRFRAWHPDAIVSVDNSFIFTEPFLSAVKDQAYNLHFGNLPRNAGWMSYAGAILNGESEYGITLHRIVRKVDAGPVCLQKTFELKPEDTSFTVFRKSHRTAIKLFRNFLDQWSKGTLEEKPQNISDRTIYLRKDFENLSFVFDREPEQISRFLRAMNFGVLSNPLPRVPVIIADQDFYLDELQIEIPEKPGRPSAVPGTILKIDATGVDIQCRGGIVRVVAIRGKPVKEALTKSAP